MSLLVLCSALSAHAYTSCSYQKIEDYSVIVDGYEWRHITYGWVCTSYSGDSGNNGGSSPTPSAPPPTLSILSMDDANPSQLKISLTGSSTITSLEVLLNGSSLGVTPGYLTSGKTVNGPSLYSTPVNRTSTVTVRGCNPDGRCASAAFSIARYRKSNGTSTTLTATYADQAALRVVIKTARYPFTMGEEFTETTYSGVYPLSNATRVQFYKANTTLAFWSTQNTPYPMYTARHWVQNLGPQSFPNSSQYFVNMTGCWLNLIGNGDTFVSYCGNPTGIGGAPTAGIQITDMMLDVPNKGIAEALTFNDSLSYQP
ncbi:MAG TPA: hypothetical protein VKB93_27495 [Thermoanaerobaculia bacterium]|nr:hypothetical protein [Thermoanaerobaculia bacterium]